MTARLREDVAFGLEDVALELDNEAAQTEVRIADGTDSYSAPALDEATVKRVKAALYRRAAELLRADKRKLPL